MLLYDMGPAHIHIEHTETQRDIVHLDLRGDHRLFKVDVVCDSAVFTILWCITTPASGRGVPADTVTNAKLFAQYWKAASSTKDKNDGSSSSRLEPELLQLLLFQRASAVLSQQHRFFRTIRLLDPRLYCLLIINLFLIILLDITSPGSVWASSV